MPFDTYTRFIMRTASGVGRSSGYSYVWQDVDARTLVSEALFKLRSETPAMLGLNPAAAEAYHALLSSLSSVQVTALTVAVATPLQTLVKLYSSARHRRADALYMNFENALDSYLQNSPGAYEPMIEKLEKLTQYLFVEAPRSIVPRQIGIAVNPPGREYIESLVDDVQTLIDELFVEKLLSD